MRLEAGDATYPTMRHKFKWAKIKFLNTLDDTAEIEIVDKDFKEIGETYKNVPIFFHCSPDAALRSNGSLEFASLAFLPGDIVIVRFEDEHPTIVSPKEKRRPCVSATLLCLDENTIVDLHIDNVNGKFEEGEEIRIFEENTYVGICYNYSPTKGILYLTDFQSWECMGKKVIGVNSGASAYVVDCKTPHFIYKVLEVPDYIDWSPVAIGTLSPLGISDLIQSPISSSDGKLCAFHPCNMVNTPFVCARYWAKTLGDVTVIAFLWTPPGESDRRWSIAATLKNQRISFQGKKMFPLQGFARDIHPNLLMPEETMQTFIGFDIFMEEGGYKISLISDQERTLYIFKIQGSDATLEATYPSKIASFVGYSEDLAQRAIRLIGHFQHFAYWCHFGSWGFIVKEDLKEGSFEVIDYENSQFPGGAITNALFHPLTKEILVEFDTGAKEETTYGLILSLSERGNSTIEANYSWLPGETCYISASEDDEITYMGEDLEELDYIGGEVPTSGPCARHSVQISDPNFYRIVCNIWGEEMPTCIFVGEVQPVPCCGLVSKGYKVNYVGTTYKHLYGLKVIGNQLFDKGFKFTYHTNYGYNVGALCNYNADGTPNINSISCFLQNWWTESRYVEGEDHYVSYSLEKWQFDPKGGFAFQVKASDSQGESVFTSGDNLLLETAVENSFPFDNWLAIWLDKSHVLYPHEGGSLLAGENYTLFPYPSGFYTTV